MTLCENLSAFYKARITFLELMNFPAGMLVKLYHDALKEAASKSGKEKMAAEAVQDAMEGI